MRKHMWTGWMIARLLTLNSLYGVRSVFVKIEAGNLKVEVNPKLDLQDQVHRPDELRRCERWN
jgi:hypothetical protein